MEKNRLSKDLRVALNAQMTKEAHASQIYLSYAGWAADQGYGGISNFLFRHANEERNHMMKLLEFILERGAKVKIEAIPAPSEDPSNIENCFEQIFNHEVDNTRGIYKIVKISFEEEDWATWHFMQWFVKEQTEEEAMALNLLNKIKIAGGANASGEAIYVLDKDLQNKSYDEVLAEDKTALKP
ncbi:MAG: ferritin [Flavisolibacter sp.]